MNRRETLRTLVAASGALTVLPAWANGWTARQMMRHPSTFSLAAQETLAAVADTIIPAGDAIGALSTGVDKFLQKLIDDCYEKEVQDNVKGQLSALDTAAADLYGKPFKTCDQAQRQAMLLKLGESANEDEREFFKLMKSETIRGFNTSREVVVTYLRYKQVPGHYHGCVDINS